jgi:hypothetical protein
VVPEEEELNLYKPEKEVKSEHFIIEEERKSEDFIIEEGELKQSSEEEYELLPGEEDQLQYIPGEVPGKKTFQAETKTYGVVSGYKNKYSQQVEIDHRQRHIDKVTKRRERELNRITGYVDKGKNQTSTINGEKARNDSSIFGTWDFIAQDLIENNKPKKWERKN